MSTLAVDKATNVAGTAYYKLIDFDTSQSVSGLGTAVSYTSVPSWTKRITAIFSEVSTSGTSPVIIQVGASTFTITGYVSSTAQSGTTVSSTLGFAIGGQAATDLRSGTATITNITGNQWICSGAIKGSTGNVWAFGGSISLGGTLDRLRITTSGGTDTFDGGTVNLLYEGYNV